MGQKIIQGNLAVDGELCVQDGIYCGENDNIFIGITEITINGSRVITEDTMPDISAYQTKEDTSLATVDQTIVGAINELNSGKMPCIKFSCGPHTKFIEIVEAIRSAGEINNFISLQLDGYLNSDFIIKVSNSEGSTSCSIVGITNQAGTLYFATGSSPFDASAVYAKDVAWCDNSAIGATIWHSIVTYDGAQRLVDEKASEVKNDLLNGAGAAYDTLKELGDLIDANTTALDALETVATNKADKSHTHTKSEITDFPTLATATTSTAGLMSAADKTKLDGLENTISSAISAAITTALNTEV